MAVSKRLRYEILRRDNHTCRYCGATAPDVPLRVDHVTPVALGGSDEPSNLVTACQDCNSGKTSSTVDSATVADVADDALRWAAAMKQAAEKLREQETPKLEYRDAFLAEWNRWHVGKDETKKVPLPNDWKQAMDRFRVAGIPTWMWADIVDISMANEKVKPENTFRYCCGIAWNKVTELQAEARRIVGAQPTTEPVAPPSSALVAAVVEAWREEAGEDIAAEQETQMASSVIDAMTDELEPEEILKAARYAAWFGSSAINDGLSHVEADKRAVEAMRWEHAWHSSCGTYPSEEETAAFEQFRDALLNAGVSEQLRATAAAVAGYSLSCVPHFGIRSEALKAAGINGKRQTAEDYWARAFAGTAARWPTTEERRKFNAQLDRLTDDGGYLIFDANAAAVAAGAAQEADLYWNIPRQLSALFAASKPVLPGGEN
ncbi:HNH endonuclease [Streptomyces sp. NPDC097640]|uniref:HNH endonuclease n=1 Tax=Streptomyces sp. NPDC097640 TaxID=3157229 RepID=UPI0033168241